MGVIVVPVEARDQGAGTGPRHRVGSPDPAQRRQLIEFVAAAYQQGRSLRELAEFTGRTQTAVRLALDEAGVARLGRGAQSVAPSGR